MVRRLLLIFCLFLGACASPSGVDAWVKPIYISKDDRLTERTAKQILTHNETLEEISKQ